MQTEPGRLQQLAAVPSSSGDSVPRRRWRILALLNTEATRDWQNSDNQIVVRVPVTLLGPQDRHGNPLYQAAALHQCREGFSNPVVVTMRVFGPDRREPSTSSPSPSPPPRQVNLASACFTSLQADVFTPLDLLSYSAITVFEASLTRAASTATNEAADVTIAIQVKYLLYSEKKFHEDCPLAKLFDL